MGDSDEEYDRRRRDKFSKERNDYPQPDRRRELPYNSDRRGPSEFNGRGGYEGRGGSRPRHDTPTEPAAKRPRREWEGDAYDPRPVGEAPVSAPVPSTPVMMTFKQFLATQDDSISDEQAISKYHEYKLEHKRQVLHAFFIAHKDEEWFKMKYNPEEANRNKKEQEERVKARLEIFEEFRAQGWLDRCSLDHTNGRNLIKFMDAVVVKLEGGTDDDVAALEHNSDDYDDGTDGEGKDKVETAPKPVPKSPPKKVEDVVPEVDDKESGEEQTNGEKMDVAEGDEEKPPQAAKTKKDEEGACSDSDSENKGDESKPTTATSAPSAGEVEEGEKPPPMLLHKTSSIFLRNIAPNITKQEVEQLSQRFPGYLRVGLADPASDRRFYRRGWISFKRDVNIKEICWQLNNVRLRETELGALVNRDLTLRIRTANGITAHKQMQMESANPLLRNITELMIEEASAEEEELLGGNQRKEDENKVTLERDETLLKALDRIILYLRIVHSIDFYNHGEYPHEDEMPNRCGLVHVRGPPPSASVYGQDDSTGNTTIPVSFVSEFIKSFEEGLQPLFTPEVRISDEDAGKLGKKDPEKEVEAYITANTQELAKDKWLCPLSGKKFKGPEFIRKHIENKHGEKLEEVKTEVEYFNNYVYDGKRATAPEAPPAATPQNSANANSADRAQRDRTPREDIPRAYDRPYDTERRGYMGGGGGYRGGGGYDNRRSYDGGGQFRSYQGGSSWRGRGDYSGGPRRDYGGDRGGYNRPPPQPRGPPPMWDGRRDPREMITYKDLDAPEDIF